MNEILYKWLEGIRRDLIANYDRLGLRASGQWERSLKSFVTEDGSKISAGMFGQDYTYWIENGRRKNQDQTDEGLKAWVGWAGSTFIDKWVHDKGISANPYAVAWKIAKKGWTVPNQFNAGGLVSDVVTKEKVQELNRNLLLSIINEFKSTVINAN